MLTNEFQAAAVANGWTPENALPEPSDPIRLNIGGGGVDIPGFVNVDRMHGREAFPLDYADGTVQEIYASHVLEHFPKTQRAAVLDDWARVLKPGGRIRISVPDFDKLARAYLSNTTHYDMKDGTKYAIDYEGVMMGGQTDENDRHGSLYTEASLWEAMQAAGLCNLALFQSVIGDNSALPFSANVEGYKPPEIYDHNGVCKRSVAAVLSLPRLNFTATMQCMFRTLPMRGIHIEAVTGAFWGQCLERGIGKCIERSVSPADAIEKVYEPLGKYDYILTIDMDSLFGDDELDRLLMFMEVHPEVDALAALQCHRDGAHVLMGKVDPKAWQNEVVPTESAHFGLTVLRTSALLKLPHPWFLGVPNAQGRWEEGRLDDDMYFWKKWREVGNSVYVSPLVPIGHMELVSAWPERTTMKHIYQRVDDFWKDGKPEGTRC